MEGSCYCYEDLYYYYSSSSSCCCCCYGNDLQPQTCLSLGCQNLRGVLLRASRARSHGEDLEGEHRNWVSDLGFRGLGFRVQGLGSRAYIESGLGIKDLCLIRIGYCRWLRLLGFGVAGFRALGFRILRLGVGLNGANPWRTRRAGD